KAIGRIGWAASLLEEQWPDGHWVTPGTSGGELYRPKYVATNWHAIVLADLGMTRGDARIRRTARLLIDRWSRKGGDLSGRSGEICVTGNAVRTLIGFGYLDDPTVQRSIAWIVRTQKPDGGWHCFPSRTGTLDGWEGLAALASALRWLRHKRGRDGTWALDAAYPDLDPALAGYQVREILFPMMLEPLHEPSPWATLEALSVLARTARS